MKRDSYFLFLVFIPLWYIFFVLMTWLNCQPISEIGEYLYLLPEGDSVPAGATCFETNHLEYLSFFEYPPPEENTLYVGGLTLLLLIGAVIVICPTIRLAKAMGHFK